MHDCFVCSSLASLHLFLAADCCIAVLLQGHYAFFLYDEQGKQVCSLMHMSPGTRCAFRFSSHLAPTYGLACTHARPCLHRQHASDSNLAAGKFHIMHPIVLELYAGSGRS